MEMDTWMYAFNTRFAGHHRLFRVPKFALACLVAAACASGDTRRVEPMRNENSKTQKKMDSSHAKMQTVLVGDVARLLIFPVLTAEFQMITSSWIIRSRLLKTHVIRHWNDGHSVRKLNTRVVGRKPGEWFTGHRVQLS